MRNANDPLLKSWVKVPEDSDFPIQNLPFGIFKTNELNPRAGIPVGDYILDLEVLLEHSFFNSLKTDVKNTFNQPFLNPLLAKGRLALSEVRNRISELLDINNSELQNRPDLIEKVLISKNRIQELKPIDSKNYTDFYSSEQHARNVGSMFRDPDNALLPNWKSLPVAYHGRTSSIVGTNVPIKRPKGQFKSKDGSIGFGLSQKLDFEFEMAFITCSNTELGEPIDTNLAENHIAGLLMFNDWSARDIQAWEYQPLGPFLGKNFASSISPWLVTLDALEPFRIEGPKQKTEPLDYLKFQKPSHFDVQLEVILRSGSSETLITKGNYKNLYWNICQQLAHHTVNGCNIQVGDIYASGTISGKEPDSYGSMLELSWNGEKPVVLNDGSERTFLEDGDEIIFKAYAEQEGIRIGFGELRNRAISN